ncbi:MULTISPECIES: polysaccharide pyruvyl transferase family protein [unclassified Acinetobacter]|uniref:polysaccharide pyruvyl transferase family protein n=1 Tax=unclassified Acinetobacter TaxID=196816 RepID=UPI0015D40A85|nr:MULTISPECIES: polysaccharide pyruvyl transferase family protein [unclassified Acinetobacter]
MTKKIAILTQPLITNFGGTLQAFALQKFLTKKGYDVEVINYQYNQISDLKKFLSIIKNIILGKNKIYPFFEKELDLIRVKHKRFIKTYMKRSKVIYSVNDLKGYFKEKKFDAVVVGSDQVWRVAYSPRIESFFLDFLYDNEKIKKVAYSASFGIDNWQFNKEKTIEIQKFVRKFDAIAVRERSAVNICHEFLNIEVQHTLDPTLLLEAKDYLELLSSSDKTICNKGKIFTYVLDNNNEKKEAIEKIAKKMNKDIYTNQPKNKVKNNLFIKDYDSYIYPSIENWIKSFHEADFIITDSFHGTVFSIIFNKPFISIVNKERGASRFESLLEQLELTNRMVYKISEISNNLLFEEIDYHLINEKLSKLKIESINYLENTLI